MLSESRGGALAGVDPLHGDAGRVIQRAAVGAPPRNIFLGSVLHNVVKAPDTDAVVACRAEVSSSVRQIQWLHA